MSDWTQFTQAGREMMAGQPRPRVLQFPQRLQTMVQGMAPPGTDEQQQRMDRIRKYREAFQNNGGRADQHYRPSTDNFIDATPPRYLR